LAELGLAIEKKKEKKKKKTPGPKGAKTHRVV
jgi:hypothetical protein